MHGKTAGDCYMPLTQEILDELQTFVKENVGEWITEISLGKPPVVYEIELRERMVRVEEELKHQRELMQQGFALMEKRFDQADNRFEQADNRFETHRQDMNTRFEQVDKRFEDLTKRLDRFMIWSFGTTFTAAVLIISAIKLW